MYCTERAAKSAGQGAHVSLRIFSVRSDGRMETYHFAVLLAHAHHLLEHVLRVRELVHGEAARHNVERLVIERQVLRIALGRVCEGGRVGQYE